MQRKKTVILFIFLLLVFVRGEAHAIPYEYSITGTASYWTADSQMVFWGQPITGSFVLNDPVRTPHPDSGHYNFSLRDVSIAGESFALSGSGNIHVLYPGTPLPDVNSWGEPDMDLNLGGYIAYDTPGLFGSQGWEYQSFFYNDNGNIDLSFRDDPYRIVFYGSIYSGPAATGNRYRLDVVALRGASVPEPSTMLLLASGLFGLVGFRKIFKN